MARRRRRKKQDPKGHFGPAYLNDLHHFEANTTEGGACLNGHEANFEKKRNKVTCNYRYQAFEKAKSDKRIRNRLHSYERKVSQVHHDDGQLRLFITTSVFSTWRGPWPSWLSAHLPLPASGDWHLGGPKRPVPRGRLDRVTETIPVGMNFTNARWPYWNNAHHLIPKGMFKATILEHGSFMAELIQVALLDVDYNINHKLNMLLIPMDLEVARILGFLRHLQLDHADAPVAKEKESHPVYDIMVRDMAKVGLRRIIGNYAAILADVEAQREDHEVPDAELDKKKLERLSETLLNLILNLGARSDGNSLDAIANRLGAGSGS